MSDNDSIRSTSASGGAPTVSPSTVPVVNRATKPGKSRREKPEANRAKPGKDPVSDKHSDRRPEDGDVKLGNRIDFEA